MTWNFADFHFNIQHWNVSWVAFGANCNRKAERNQINFNIISCSRMSNHFFLSFFFLLLNCLCAAHIVSKAICNINWNIFLIARMVNRRSATQLHSIRVADYWVWEMHAKFTRFSQQKKISTDITSHASFDRVCLLMNIHEMILSTLTSIGAQVYLMPTGIAIRMTVMSRQSECR